MREVLRHTSVEQVVMVDIDKVSLSGSISEVNCRSTSSFIHSINMAQLHLLVSQADTSHAACLLAGMPAACASILGISMLTKGPLVHFQVVCDFCAEHLEANKAAFADKRLQLIIDDARKQLEEAADGQFDVIIGDLADPVYGGPCYQV